MLNTLQRWTACFPFVFFLGHSALLSYVNQALDTGEKHHRCIRGSYYQNKLDTQRRIRLFKLFTDIHKTTLKNQSVSIFTAYCIGRQLCPTLCAPTDCSPPGFFARGISQARRLELPLSTPGNFPNPGIKPMSPALTTDSLPMNQQEIGPLRWCSGKESTCQCRRHERCREDSMNRGAWWVTVHSVTKSQM